MKKATFEDMELGNMMFGNSRGVYHVEPRRDYQDPFCKFLDRAGFDFYGYYKDGSNYYENDVFIIRAYYWGEDDEIAELPNFVYKPTGLEIRWYKYPMRDAYSNQDVGVEDFMGLLEACEKSMQKEAT